MYCLSIELGIFSRRQSFYGIKIICILLCFLYRVLLYNPGYLTLCFLAVGITMFVYCAISGVLQIRISSFNIIMDIFINIQRISRIKRKCP